MVPKHIAQVLLEDLLPVFDSRSPALDGVGVNGVFGGESEYLVVAGEVVETSENLPWLSPSDGDASSWDLGT